MYAWNQEGDRRRCAGQSRRGNLVTQRRSRESDRGLTQVSDGYKQDADNYYAARSRTTAKAFAAAYDVQRHRP
ncbi:MAG: hypothetical protein ACLT1W_14890 [Alistipes onderdonkii]